MKKKRDDNDEDDDNDEMMIVKKVVSHSWAEFYFVNIYDFLEEREISRTSFPWNDESFSNKIFSRFKIYKWTTALFCI